MGKGVWFYYLYYFHAPIVYYIIYTTMFKLFEKVLATLLLASLLGYLYDKVGFLAGFILGAAIDTWRHLLIKKPKRKQKIMRQADITDFIVSTILLSAAVVKADGDMDESELAYLRRFFTEQFGEAQSLEYMTIFKNSYQGDFDIKETALNIKDTTDYETRLQLIYILLGVSNADFEYNKAESKLVKEIASYLEIESNDFDSISAMFSKEMYDYYKILEVTPAASDKTIKAAYKKLLVKYHPDKVAHLGEEMAITAKRKYEKLQEAYLAIKQNRGF